MTITLEEFTAIAYKGGYASRQLGKRYEDNPYSEVSVSPKRREECAAKRAAWYQGWIEADTDIAMSKRG